MKHVAVVGAGVAGLAAAHRLAAGGGARVTLVEQAARAGGWVRAERRGGFLFETGPRTLRPFGRAGEATLDLVGSSGSGLFRRRSAHGLVPT